MGSLKAPGMDRLPKAGNFWLIVHIYGHGHNTLAKARNMSGLIKYSDIAHKYGRKYSFWTLSIKYGRSHGTKP
jgi:hypothetical protein